MLRAIPQNLLTWNCDLQENNFSIGNLEFSLWKKRGKIITRDSEYRVRCQGILTTNFFMDNYDFRLGWAKQTTSLARVLDLNYGRNNYQLKAASPLSKKFIIQQQKKTLGMIYSKNILERQAIIDLSPNLPLEFKLFATWIVIWFWRCSDRNIV